MSLFRRKVNEKELYDVIRQSLFMIIVGSFLIGALHVLLMVTSDLSLIWMMLILFGFLFAKRLKSTYSQHHVVYSIIGVLAIILTYYFLNVVSILVLAAVRDSLSLDFIIRVLDLQYHFQFLNIFGQGFFKVNNLINVVFFALVNIYTFKAIK